MKRLYSFITVLLSTVLGVSAQHDPYEVLFNGTAADEAAYTDDEGHTIFTSEELFLQPLAGQESLFGTVTRSSYLPVRYSRGGAGRQRASVMLMGVDLSGNLNSAPVYNLWSALHRSKLTGSPEADAPYFTNGSDLASRTSYDFIPATVPRRTSFALIGTDRKGRLGLKAAASGSAGGWTYMADVYRRWGPDAAVGGVFTDRIAYSAGVSGLVGKHRVTIFSAGDRSEDGLRSYITKEAAALAGSNRYNPSWGYHDGKVRNARVAKGFVPVTVLSYEVAAGRGWTIRASLGYMGGEKSVSGLSWLDAATPYPDYYRYMPSYAASNAAEALITEKWKSGDAAVTQIDWSGLYAVNRMNPASAVYTLSDMVERTRDIQGYGAAEWRVDERTTLGISLRSRSDNVRRYRKMKDLLGGIAPDDIDQYLYEDELYGDRILNNVADPHRKVNEGDVFGYDYDITARQVEGTVTAEYRPGALTLNAAAGLALTTFGRNGRFEKEIYPGDLSLGRSETSRYETYSAELRVGYAVTAAHRLTGHLQAARSPQPWAVHFITPRYSNRTTGVDRPVTTMSARAGYAYRGRNVSASLDVFHKAIWGRAETYNYWDDISSTYSTMLVENVGERNSGVEVAVDYDPHPRWNLAAAAALGSYKYSTDPAVTIYSENTLESYVEGAVSYLKGYHTGASPERFFTARARYSASGFITTLTVNHAGGRYVSPSPLRRMARAYNLASSAEGLAEFTGQEKLADAFTVDLSVLKSFRIGESYLSVFLSVSNLLDDRNIVYGAYEQMRIARRGSGVNATWKPMDTKYLYAYGRGYYLSITYTF